VAKCHNGPVPISTKRNLHKQSAPPATLVTELHCRHVSTTGDISITHANDKCGNQHTKPSIRPGLTPR
jgi:hypothetical protein